jgi:hypothetical protein
MEYLVAMDRGSVADCGDRSVSLSALRHSRSPSADEPSGDVVVLFFLHTRRNHQRRERPTTP